MDAPLRWPKLKILQRERGRAGRRGARSLPPAVQVAREWPQSGQAGAHRALSFYSGLLVSPGQLLRRTHRLISSEKSQNEKQKFARRFSLTIPSESLSFVMREFQLIAN